MIIVVCGPTAVGKTKMSVELAKIYNGEIINADSTQVYKGLDVGTAKVTKEEMEHIPHHLLSFKEVDDMYTVYDYQSDARRCIDEIKKKGKVPIMVGGTGYYIKSALYDYDFNEEDSDIDINDNDYINYTNEELVEMLDEYECEISIDKGNRKRLIRMLNKLKSGWMPEKKDYKCLYDDVIFIGLTTDRDILYNRINKRFDDMLVSLIDEVKPYAINNIRSKALMTAIGYKELYPFFENEKTLQEVVEECKQNIRNYAKRQYTWFNNQQDVKWFDVDFENFNNTVQEVVEYIETK